MEGGYIPFHGAWNPILVSCEGSQLLILLLFLQKSLDDGFCQEQIKF